jgi:hypothetical protein
MESLEACERMCAENTQDEKESKARRKGAGSGLKEHSVQSLKKRPHPQQ